NLIIPSIEIQTNEIVSITDLLITDYSSVFFDFLVTERPIIHYVNDIDDYSNERGLNLIDKQLLVIIVKDRNNLASAINKVFKMDVISSNYSEAQKRFSPYDD